jgi:hypothetical protein
MMPTKRFGKGKDTYNIHAYLEKHGDFANMLERYSLTVTEDGRLMINDPMKEYCPPEVGVAASKDHKLVVK